MIGIDSISRRLGGAIVDTARCDRNQIPRPAFLAG
jgi:hypothetical protein